MSVENIDRENRAEEADIVYLNKILTDRLERGLFERYLNSRPEDQVVLREIYEQYRSGEPFNQEQLDFFRKRLPEFKERMLLSQEAALLVGPKDIETASEHYEPLKELLAQNSKSKEMLEVYLSVMAMEQPQLVRVILDNKREINKSKRVVRARHKEVENILKKYTVSKDEMSAVRGIDDEVVRRAEFYKLINEKIRKTEEAVHFSKAEIDRDYSALTDSEKDELIRRSDTHEKVIASILNDLSVRDPQFLEAILYGGSNEAAEEDAKNGWKNAIAMTLAGTGALLNGAKDMAIDYVEGEAQWLKGIAAALFSGASGMKFETKSDHHNKQKSEKKGGKEKIEGGGRDSLKDKKYKKPEEFQKKFKKLIEGDDFKTAQILVDYHFPMNDDSRTAYEELSHALANKDRELANSVLKKFFEARQEKE